MAPASSTQLGDTGVLEGTGERACAEEELKDPGGYQTLQSARQASNSGASSTSRPHCLLFEAVAQLLCWGRGQRQGLPQQPTLQMR